MAATVSDDFSRIEPPPKLLYSKSSSKKSKKNKSSYVVYTFECVINVIYIISHDLDSPTLIHRSPDGMFLIGRESNFFLLCFVLILEKKKGYYIAALQAYYYYYL